MSFDFLEEDFLDVHKDELQRQKEQAEYAGVSLTDWLLYGVLNELQTITAVMYESR